MTPDDFTDAQRDLAVGIPAGLRRPLPAVVPVDLLLAEIELDGAVDQILGR